MAVVIMKRRLSLAPVIIVAALMFFAILSAASARPLGGGDDGWGVAAGAGGPFPGGESIVQVLRRLYLQQLGGPGPSCSTNSPNNSCPP